MITTTIFIKPYLAEYVRGKFNNFSEEPLTVPCRSDLYHLLWELMTKTPMGQKPCLTQKEGLVINLPKRRCGKDPLYFNYLSETSVKMIEKHIKRMFDYELHSLMVENICNGRKLSDIQVVHQFMDSYGIVSVEDNSLIKNFYRWRIQTDKYLKIK